MAKSPMAATLAVGSRYVKCNVAERLFPIGTTVLAPFGAKRASRDFKRGH
jgi:hypothetical protein